MKNKKAKGIIKKYLSKKSSDEENALLDSWFLQKLEKSDAPKTSVDYDKVGAEILEKLRKDQQSIPARRRIGWRVAAAVAIFLLALGALFMYPYKGSNQNQLANGNDFLPGKHAGTLTLSNGQHIALSDLGKSTVAKEAGVAISKAANGDLVYTISETTANQINKENILHTGNAQHYKVVLQDGTAVWLNAASALTYPVSFKNATERRVKLSGEAYFEVHQDASRPFKVITTTEEIKVLGTHFNTRSYADDVSRQTTLLEGSIAVNNLLRPDSEVLLKPGQQLVSDGKHSVVTNIDAEDAIAWKEGLFYFNEQSLDIIMRDIARWYDVPVVFKDDSVKAILYSGTISRYSNVSQVLKKIEQMGGVKFVISAEQITIEKN